MNKKIFILPLAVIAMGLTSCNKNWPTITDDKSKEIVTNILNMSKIQKMILDDYSGLSAIASFNMNIENRISVSGKITEKSTENMKVDLNVNKNYYHSYGSREELSGTEKTNDYITYKEGKKYTLNKLTSEGKYSVCSESTCKTDLKNSTYEQYYTDSQEGGCKDIYSKMLLWDAWLATFKETNKQYKNNKTYHFTYELGSNDNKDSLQLIVDAKTPKGVLEEETTGTYKIEKMNVTITHGMVTNFYFETEHNYKDANGVERIEYSKTNSSYNFDSASVDDINLNDYYITEE